MAERRMFAKTVIDSDAFLDMPLTTQALYFHLSMRADDDGIVNNPKKIQRMVGASVDDAKLLAAKQFIIPFDSGIVAIRHWKLHNYIRSDRYNPSVCIAEKAQLTLTSSGVYERNPHGGIPGDKAPVSQRSTTGIPDGAPEVDAGKVRIGKDRIGKDREEASEEVSRSPAAPKQTNVDRQEAASSAPSLLSFYGTYGNVKLTGKELEDLQKEFPFDYQARIDRLSAYMESSGRKYHSHFATIRSWAQDDAKKNPPPNAAAPLPDWMAGKVV